MNPEHPIYIPSKGRAESRLTVKALDRMGVLYRVIVEQQEYDQYAAVIDSARLLVLDPAYQRDYDALCDLEPGQSKGSGPARNFAWDHALSLGASHHWIIDDNIRAFMRLQHNEKRYQRSGDDFWHMEQFAARYSNVAMFGPAYEFHAKHRQPIKPFILNTRLYSCICIRNDIPFRWRGRYNEDTILSIDVLKAGWATIEFNMFLQCKAATQTMKGGNTDELYARGTLEKSRMLAREHPDVCEVTWKYGRWHHHCNYKAFKYTALEPRAAVVAGETV